MLGKLKFFWRVLRRLSGDDAYEQYLVQHAMHEHEEPPLNKQEFFKQWQDNKWKGVKRCC